MPGRGGERLTGSFSPLPRGGVDSYSRCSSGTGGAITPVSGSVPPRQWNRSGTPATPTTRRKRKHYGYSYAGIACVAAFTHGCLYRGATLAMAAHPGSSSRPSAAVEAAEAVARSIDREPALRGTTNGLLVVDTPIARGGGRSTQGGDTTFAAAAAAVTVTDMILVLDTAQQTKKTIASAVAEDGLRDNDASPTGAAAAAADGATAGASTASASVSRVAAAAAVAETGHGVTFATARPPSPSSTRRLQQQTPSPVEQPAANDDGRGRGGEQDGKDDDGEDDGEVDDDEDGTTQERMLVILTIVAGCGVLTLVLLCVVRKVMDLCLLRNDPTGSLRYSQEEGLPKRSIERLPQTRYKTPASGTPTTAAKKAHKKSSSFRSGSKKAAVREGRADGTTAEEGADSNVPGAAGAGTAGAAVGGGGAAGGEERDSTADMCAICLVEYENGDELRIIPNCDHHFHKDCIDPWLETKAVCAYCKAKVEARTTCCDRVFRGASSRLGLNLVAPTTIRFSSSRRTYTNEDVQLAMGPSLPASYGRSDVDYVGSAVAPRQGSMDMELGPAAATGAATAEGAAEAEAEGSGVGARAAMGGMAAGGGGTSLGVSGSTRSTRGAVVVPDTGGPAQEGTIVVQPASAPSYVVVPRESLSLGGGDESGESGAGGGGGGGGGGFGAHAISYESPRGNISYESPRGVPVGGRAGSLGVLLGVRTGSTTTTTNPPPAFGGEEKREAEEVGAGAGAGAGKPHERRPGRRSGVSDGLGGVVFGGDTEEFREAAAAAAAAEGKAGEDGPAAVTSGGLQEKVL